MGQLSDIDAWSFIGGDWNLDILFLNGQSVNKLLFSILQLFMLFIQFIGRCLTSPFAPNLILICWKFCFGKWLICWWLLFFFLWWEGIWNIAFCNQHKYIMLEMIGINVILKLCISTLEQFTKFYARFWKIGSIYVLWDFQPGSCEPSTRPLFLYVILDIVLISQSSAKIWSNSILS